MWERDTAPWRSTLLILVILLFEPRAARGQDSSSEEGVARVSVLGRSDRNLINSANEAVREASRRLQDPGCAMVFSDFKDGSGRALSEILRARGETGSGFLRWLIFVNVAESSFCLREQGVLGTNVGDRVVRLCPRFARIQLADPDYAAFLVIHEELHVLGLAENPPSSAEITRRVAARCGSSTSADRLP